MAMHLLLLLRGFQSDGPGWQVLDTLKALDPGEIRVSVLALDSEGPLRPHLEGEVTRLGGEFTIFPTSWISARKTARRIAAQPWFDSVTHLCSHLLRPDLVGRILSRRTGRPVLVVEHGLHAWGDKGMVLRPLVGFLYRRLAHRGVWFGAVSDKVRRQLIRAGISRRRILPVPNGVDLGRFPLVTSGERQAAREELSIRENEVVLLGVGGLTLNKRWEVAIRSLEPLDARYRLILAGEGPARKVLQDIARREGVSERVDFVGSIGEIERLYAAADVLVHPSAQESYGRVVVEALSRGLPVAVRAGSGADKVVPPWPMAAVVEGGNPDHWAPVLTSLLTEQQTGGEEFSKSRSHFATQHHDATNTARALLEALATLTVGPSKKKRKPR